jgi:hypothetical protein
MTLHIFETNYPENNLFFNITQSPTRKFSKFPFKYPYYAFFTHFLSPALLLHVPTLSFSPIWPRLYYMLYYMYCESPGHAFPYIFTLFPLILSLNLPSSTLFSNTFYVLAHTKKKKTKPLKFCVKFLSSGHLTLSSTKLCKTKGR